MRRPTLLITGFGPFPGMPRNPSAGAAIRSAASQRWRILGVATRCRILTTSYAALDTELDPALAEQPDAVLLIGVAGRASRVRVEMRGTSRRSTLFADAAGERAGRGQVACDERRTRLPPKTALLALTRRGIASYISRDAGRYLCNASYFRALAAPVPVLFIHVPKTPRRDRPALPGTRCRLNWPDRLDAALVEIGSLLMREGRNRARVASAKRLG